MVSRARLWCPGAMMLCADTSDRLSWLGLVLALALVSAGAEAEYRQLCTSVPSACEYTGPDAPKLDVDVCAAR